jgi:hypothetical protein
MAKRGSEGQDLPITAADAIFQAMKALGGIRTRIEVELWISNHLEQQWADIGTAMADLTYPGNDSSHYKPEERFLERVSFAKYRLIQNAARPHSS